MAFQSPPSTPKLASVATPTPDESQTPGKWRHPHLSEIVRRQNAATFGDRDMKKLLWNGPALATSWVLGDSLSAS